MIDHRKRAKELFLEGYNCSQSVFGAFCEEMYMDLKTAVKFASSFGGGMGRMREVCGTVSGMLMVAAVLFGYDDPKDKKVKTEHYKRVQELAGEFRKANGSIVCRVLLGIEGKDSNYVPSDRTEEYYKKRPCLELVQLSAGIMEDYIIKNKELLNK